MLKVYGLKNCDTCRKALKWLAAEAIEHDFLDVRKDGVDTADLHRWLKTHGWETVINRRGTSWRGLDEADKTDMNCARAVKLAVETPALLKRPIFDNDIFSAIGFTPEVQAALKEL